MKRCFLSSISAVSIRGFQGVHPKNLLALQYVRNFLPSCITCLYLSLCIHRSILRSCDRKCHKSKAKSLFVGRRTWKFSPKNLRTEKIPRQIIFKSIKAFKRYVARFLKRCP